MTRAIAEDMIGEYFLSCVFVHMVCRSSWYDYSFLTNRSPRTDTTHDQEQLGLGTAPEALLSLLHLTYEAFYSLDDPQAIHA